MSHEAGEAVGVDGQLDATPEHATQARALAAVLESVATALTDMAVSVRSALEQIRNEPAPGEQHRCVMPREAPVFTIHRCSCGKSYRLYPPNAVGHPSAEQGLAQWREI